MDLFNIRQIFAGLKAGKTLASITMDSSLKGSNEERCKLAPGAVSRKPGNR